MSPVINGKISSYGRQRYQDILKDILVGNRKVDEDLNVIAFTELIQFLDYRYLSLFICDAKDNVRKAFKILRQLYSQCNKPKTLIKNPIKHYQTKHTDICYLQNATKKIILVLNVVHQMKAMKIYLPNYHKGFI